MQKDNTKQGKKHPWKHRILAKKGQWNYLSGTEIRGEMVF
jgi:hypothetical protein